MNYTKKTLTIHEVKNLMRQFVKDEVHDCDYAQGQSFESTMSCFERWWKSKESKIEKISK